MTSFHRKKEYFLLEALNSFATTFYFYYLFFFMAREYSFDDRKNLLLAAVNGLVYLVGAWVGGQFGQKLGYFKALGFGLSIMASSMVLGAWVQGWAAHVSAMIACTIGMCFTWPSLQALVSEKENPYGLQQMVGIYNLVWSTAGSLAFFSGGALLQAFGLKSLFWVPLGIYLLELALLW